MLKRRNKFEIPVELTGLEEGNFHLLLRSVFKDGAIKYWILDTGASKSVFDIAETNYYTPVSKSGLQVNSAGIGAGHIETSVGILQSFSLADFKKRSFEVALIDLEPINQIYGQFSPHRISGLIGSDFLVRHKALIDYQKKRLTLHR